MCAVDQERPFLSRAGPFFDLLPLRDLSPLQGPLRADRLRRGWEPLREGALQGKAVSYGVPLQGISVCAIDQKRPFLIRVGPFLPSKGPFPLTALTGRPPTSRLGALTERLLTRQGCLLRSALTRHFRLCAVDLTRHFRLCAVDQKRPFLVRAGPFLDLVPFEGPFPLAGALTGRPPIGRRDRPLRRPGPYGKVPGTPLSRGAFARLGRIFWAPAPIGIFCAVGPL